MNTKTDMPHLKKHRNQLWHMRIYGQYLPTSAGQQVYLISIMDDATRSVMRAAFYPALDHVSIEDCFRQAVRQFGAPEEVSIDHGEQYQTGFVDALVGLGITVLCTSPHDEGRGMVDRFNRGAAAFLSKSALGKPLSLDQLNGLFDIWLAGYQDKPHSALENKQSPAAYISSLKTMQKR